MTRRRIVALSLAAALLGAAPAAGASHLVSGTWRTEGPGSVNVRVQADGRIELHDPASGRRVQAEPLPFGQGEDRAMAMLPGAEVVAVGRQGGRTVMAVGDKLFVLAPLAAGEYARAGAAPAAPAGPVTPVAAVAGAAAPGGMLAGRRLSAAEGSNGGYRDLWVYDFCSDGSFRLQRMTTGPGVASERKHHGRWAMDSGGVQLRFENGNGRVAPLARIEANVVQMEGRKFLVERSGLCA